MSRTALLFTTLVATGCGLFGGKNEPTGNACVDDPTVSITVRPATAMMKPGDRLTFDYEIRSQKGTATASASVEAGALEPAGSNAVWWTAPSFPGTYALTITRDGCPNDTGTATVTVTALDDPGPAPGQQPTPNGVAFSPDGQRVAVAGNGGVWLFQRDGTFVDSLKLPQRNAVAVAFSPDGATLAVGGGGRGLLVKVDGMAPIANVGLSDADGVVFSEDGATLYLNEKTQLTKVDLATGQGTVVAPLTQPSVPTTAPYRVQLGPLGSLVAVAPGELREVSTGRLMVRWFQGEAWGAAVLAKDASWLLGPGGLQFPFFPTASAGGSGGIVSAARSHAGDVVALGLPDGKVDVVRIVNGATQHVATLTLPNTPGAVKDLAWSPDDAFLAVAGTPRLYVATRAELGL